MRRESTPFTSHFTEDCAAVPSKNNTAIIGRGPNGRDDPNERGDDSENDFGENIERRIRFAKRPKMSTSIRESFISKRFSSDRASVTSRNEIGGLSAVRMCSKKPPVGVKDGGMSSKKRRLNETRSESAFKRRINQHIERSLFVISSSDISNRDSCIPPQTKDALTLLHRLQRRRRHRPRISVDDSSSEEMSSTDDTQNFYGDSLVPPNLSSENTSLMKVRKSNPRLCAELQETSDERNDSQDEGQTLEKKVWEYCELLGYREVNGEPEVAVPWKFTWEPAGEFLRDEVAKVKKEWERQRATSARTKRDRTRPRPRGRPPAFAYDRW